MNKKTEYSNPLGYLLNILVGTLLFLAGVLLYIVILPRIIHFTPWFVQLWIFETIWIPIMLLCFCIFPRLYPHPKLLLEMRQKHLLFVFIVVYLYCLGLVFLAFLFGTFTPFLPVDFKDWILPSFLDLAAFTIIGTTKIRFVLWQFAKRFFKEA